MPRTTYDVAVSFRGRESGTWPTIPISYGRCRPFGLNHLVVYSTAWLCVTLATRRFSSSRTSDSTTMIRRPTWSGRATAVALPDRTARRKLVLDSIVVVPDDPLGRFMNAHRAATLSASA